MKKRPQASPFLRKMVLLLGVVLGLFFVGSFFISEEVKVVTEVEFEQSSDQILNVIHDLPTWEDWSVWNEEFYQGKKLVYFMGTKNVLKVYSKDNDKTSDPKLPASREKSDFLVESVHQGDWVESIYSMSESDFQANNRFEIVEEEAIKKLVWTYTADYSEVVGINPLGRYLLIFTKKSLQDHNQKSLNQLIEYLR